MQIQWTCKVASTILLTLQIKHQQQQLSHTQYHWWKYLRMAQKKFFFTVECQYAILWIWRNELSFHFMWKQNFFFRLNRNGWIMWVSDVLNDSFIKYCTKTFSSLINSVKQQQAPEKMANRTGKNDECSNGFKLHCCLKKFFMFAHFVSFNFTRFWETKKKQQKQQHVEMWRGTNFIFYIV